MGMSTLSSVGSREYGPPVPAPGLRAKRRTTDPNHSPSTALPVSRRAAPYRAPMSHRPLSQHLMCPGSIPSEYALNTGRGRACGVGASSCSFFGTMSRRRGLGAGAGDELGAPDPRAHLSHGQSARRARLPLRTSDTCVDCDARSTGSQQRRLAAFARGVADWHDTEPACVTHAGARCGQGRASRSVRRDARPGVESASVSRDRLLVEQHTPKRARLLATSMRG